MSALNKCAAVAVLAIAASMGSFAIAAPLANSVGDAGYALKAQAGQTAIVEDVTWRRCWWHRGHRHCSGRPHFSFFYGPRHHRWR